MRTLIHGGPIFTAKSERLLDGYGVVIEGGTIVALAPVGDLLPGFAPDAILDIQGGTLLPGLIDAHRHLIGASAPEVDARFVAVGTLTGARVAAETLHAGITTVRDAGCRHDGIFELRRAIETGLVVGPTIYAAGRNPTGHAAPRGWRNLYVTGPESMRQAVRELRRDGADWIKLVVSEATNESDWNFVARYLSNAEIRAAVEEAHALGLRISCHVEGLDAARAVVAAGVDAIEHGTVLDQELAEAMAKRGVFYVPTLWVYANELSWGTIYPHQLAAYRKRQAAHDEAFRLALAAGVPVAVGTDSVEPIPPADCLVCELEHMVALGMSPTAALYAATHGGAAILGQTTRLGTIESGKQADILVVRGNPLETPAALRQVALVLKAGVVASRPGTSPAHYG